MRYIKIFMASLAIFIGIGAAVPTLASAETSKQSVCKSLGSNDKCTSTPSNSVSLNSVISAIINIFSWIIGVTAVIMMMIGGFKFVTANGDSNSVSSARNTILYAAIGLVVAAFAQIIVKFVLTKTT